MDIKRAYDETGNKVYVYSVASGIFVDETEKKTLANVMAEKDNEIQNINSDITELHSDISENNNKIDEFINSTSENTLSFKGILTTQDLDNLIETGFYVIEDATNITNLPTDLNSDYDNSIVVVIANSDNIFQKIISLNNTLIFYRSKKESGLFTKWKYNLTVKSTILDKDKTSLTLPNSMGSINYFIKDGWCTVEFKDIAGDTTNIDIMETEELPTPNLSTTGILENNGIVTGSISVSGNNTNTGVKITAHKNSSTLGFATLTYKIDQSKY